MAYKRAVNAEALTSGEKKALLAEYFAHYEREAARDRTTLNRKLPRTAFSRLIDRIGEVVVEESTRLAEEPGDVREFLEANPLPGGIDELLPREFRTRCLALNALKQWVVAEQAASDRFLLGGKARDLCRAVAKRCLVTGEPLGGEVELHHPVRDGRPPLPLTKRGHAIIEEQLTEPSGDADSELVALKRGSNRSWVMLRRGCIELMGKPVRTSAKSSAANARAFARKAAAVSNLSFEEIIAWLDAKGL
jgi:hypothetical protein